MPLRLSIALVGGLILSTLAANAQTPGFALSNFQTAFPGAIYVSPLDSKYTAPAIYRSYDAAPGLTASMQIEQICPADFRITRALKSLHKTISVEADYTDTVDKQFGIAIAGNIMRSVEASGNIEYQSMGTFSAVDVKAFRSDPDIAQFVLRHISANCRGIIRKHLAIGRAVFIAKAAIQAKNLNVHFDYGPKADAQAKCSRWLPWNCKVEVNADLRRNFGRAAKTYVTFALVADEIGGARKQVISEDIEAPSVATHRKSRTAGLPRARRSL
jgi:hypothetical protein